MSTEILTLEPEFGLEESIDFKTLITEMEDGDEKRRAKWTWGLRRYKLRLYAYTKTNMDTIWDFFIARKGASDTFLVKIPAEYEIETEAIGTGNGVRTTFTLDEFPVDTSANFTMYVDGSSVSATLSNNFDTEFSYVTFDSAPTNTKAVTGDYHIYFRVRFMNDRMTRNLMAYLLLSAGLELKEDRWDIYRPRAGRTDLIFGSVSDSITVTENVTLKMWMNSYIVKSVTVTESVTMHTSMYHLYAIDIVTITESRSGSPA